MGIGVLLFIAIGITSAALVDDYDPITVINTLVCSLFAVIWGIAGGIAALIIAISGLKWVMSQEDPGSRKAQTENIKHAVVGLLIIMVASAVVTKVTSGNWYFGACLPSGIPIFGTSGGGGAPSTAATISGTVFSADGVRPARAAGYTSTNYAPANLHIEVYPMVPGMTGIGMIAQSDVPAGSSDYSVSVEVSRIPADAVGVKIWVFMNPGPGGGNEQAHCRLDAPEVLKASLTAGANIGGVKIIAKKINQDTGAPQTHDEAGCTGTWAWTSGTQ